jgi:hypothetical protein
LRSAPHVVACLCAVVAMALAGASARAADAPAKTAPAKTAPNSPPKKKPPTGPTTAELMKLLDEQRALIAEQQKLIADQQAKLAEQQTKLDAQDAAIEEQKKQLAIFQEQRPVARLHHRPDVVDLFRSGSQSRRHGLRGGERRKRHSSSAGPLLRPGP